MNATATETREPWQVLASADAVLGALIERAGPLRLPDGREPFAALVRSIVGQQLSMAAASTIWLRVVALAGEVTPEAFVRLSAEELRGAGLSRAKAAYVHDLATRVLEGELDLGALPALSDDDVIAEVTKVKGIGRWSAEMFLVFSLGRPDVLALDDAGLLRAAGWLLGLGRAATRGELAEAGERWRPYRSLASLYLWHALGEGYVRDALTP